MIQGWATGGREHTFPIGVRARGASAVASPPCDDFPFECNIIPYTPVIPKLGRAMCTRRTESEVLTRGKGTGKLSAPRSLAPAKYRRHMICTMRREILLVCATTCVRAHAGSASGTESHRSRDLDLPRDERQTNIRYSVVEFTGLVQVQMSPQGRTLRRHSNRRVGSPWSPQDDESPL